MWYIYFLWHSVQLIPIRLVQIPTCPAAFGIEALAIQIAAGDGNSRILLVGALDVVVPLTRGDGAMVGLGLAAW